MEILEEIETELDIDWEEAERFWISTFRFYGFNLTNLESGGGSGKKMDSETKEKIGSAHRGKQRPQSWKDNIGAAHRGMKRSEEARKNMRVKKNPGFSEMLRRRMIGFKHSEKARLNMKASKQNMSAEWRGKISKSLKGIKFSEEHKRRIAEGLKGNVRPESVRQKLREANLGKKHTEESKRRMSETRKAIGAAGLHWKQVEKRKRDEETRRGSAQGLRKARI